MGVSFNSIPLDLRTPGAFVEFDASRAVRGLPSTPHRALIIGQMLAAGAAVANTPILVRTVDEAIVAGGRGSMLHRMFKAFKANDAVTETWAFPMADVAGGTAAAGTIVLTGPSTAAGTLALLIAGQAVPVAIASGLSATNAGVAVAAAINAAVDLPVTAAAAIGTVTLTARHKGVAGNYIDVRLNHYQGEATPAGLTAEITALSAGATNPDLSAVFAAIGDTPFTAFINPYSDATNLAAIETGLATRWGPMKALDGMAYSAASNTYAGLVALGTSRNSAFNTIIGAKGSPTPPWEWAAAYGAQVGFAGAVDPARPFQTLPLHGVIAPAIVDRFVQSERDTLLRDGISTFTVQGGVVTIERAITTYQTSPIGLADIAFLDVNTPLTLASLRYSLRARVSSKFPRHKLVSDETVIPAGQPMINPRGLRSEVIAWFMDAQSVGLVEGLEQFKTDLVLERDATDPSRINALIPPDLVNQFRVFAGQVQFLL